jgi:RNA polymerase sigma-70 factor (ECF subfamily)
MTLAMTEDRPDSLPTRYSLINRLKDWQDSASWQEFFDSYWELIYNVARKAGLTDAEAQEVVQETVVGVAKQIGEFKADPARGSFKAWLMRQTRWRIADQFRQRQRSGRAQPTSQLEMPRSPTMDEADRTDTLHRIPDPGGVALESVWDEEWARNLTTRALERVKCRVSGQQFQIFDLHVIQNLPVSETARTLRVNAASVYMAKYRVGALLKKELRKLEHLMH